MEIHITWINLRIVIHRLDRIGKCRHQSWKPVFFANHQKWTCANPQMVDNGDMMKANDLAEALGRKNMADALGIGATAISNAVVRGSFPASWFMACKSLADRIGTECPPDLFNFVEAKAS